jgi:hypothetical protein
LGLAVVVVLTGLPEDLHLEVAVVQVAVVQNHRVLEELLLQTLETLEEHLLEVVVVVVQDQQDRVHQLHQHQEDLAHRI